MADLRIVVIESDDFLRDTVCTQLADMSHVTVAGQTPDLASAQRLTAQTRPDVVILEIPAMPETALEFAEWLRVAHPEAMILGASAVTNAELLRRVMRAGAQDLLARPIEATQLRQAIDHALEQKSRRARSTTHHGRVVSFFGVSGGLGTTTIATNTAVTLAARSDHSVLLADFDLHMGNVSCFLDLPAKPNHLQVLGELPKLDAEALRQFVQRHESGIYMLPGPPSLEDLESITSGQVAELIERCREAFGFTIVDAGHGFDDRQTEVLDRSELIMVVTQLNVAALHATRRTVETLRRLGYTADQMHIIANRVGRGSQVTFEDVQQSVGQEISFSIANDYPTVIQAIDSGVPIAIAKRSGRTIPGFKSIAEALAERHGPVDADHAASTNGLANGNGKQPTNGPIGRLVKQFKKA